MYEKYPTRFEIEYPEAGAILARLFSSERHVHVVVEKSIRNAA